MTKPNECYAYFAISGSFEPSEITRRIGINATKSCREGEMIPRSQMRRKCSRWELHSRLDKAATSEEHVADVLAQLDVKAETFRELSREFGGVMELVGYFNDYPGLTFTDEIVQRLASYSLSVDFDFYVRGPGEIASNK